MVNEFCMHLLVLRICFLQDPKIKDPCTQFRSTDCIKLSGFIILADGILESNAKLRSSANWWITNTTRTFLKASIKTHPRTVEAAQQERKNKHCKQLSLPIIPRSIVKIIIKQESNYAQKGTSFLSGKYAFTS